MAGEASRAGAITDRGRTDEGVEASRSSDTKSKTAFSSSVTVDAVEQPSHAVAALNNDHFSQPWATQGYCSASRASATAASSRCDMEKKKAELS